MLLIRYHLSFRVVFQTTGSLNFVLNDVERQTNYIVFHTYIDNYYLIDALSKSVNR